MSGGVSVIDGSRDARWAAFTEAHPDATLYHTPHWQAVVRDTYGYEPLAFVVRDADGAVRSGIPVFLVRSCLTGRRLVALAFSDYCDPLLGRADDLDPLLERMRAEAARRRATLEIRVRDGAWLGARPDFAAEARYLNHVIDLTPGRDAVRRGLSRNVRYNIRRSERTALDARAAGQEADMRAFFDLYVGTRREHGLPPQPYAFFRNLWRRIGTQQGLRLFLACVGDRPVAGSLGVVYKTTFYALYAASRRDALRLRPNHLLYWHEVRLALDTGLTRYDLGRTAAGNAGLRQFKQAWGAAERPITHGYWPPGGRRVGINRGGGAGSWVRAVVRRTPRPVLRWAGARLYRHIG
ncbi:MAG: GNAT family N-acetyltransferase [Lentisphaerae bacterium]|nr:GNAT family N-acetyltransferase [Lentisphaerota bacterium]